MTCRACFTESSSSRNKLKYRDSPFVTKGAPNELYNSLDEFNRLIDRKKQFIKSKRESAIKSLYDDLENAEKSATLPFEPEGHCDPFENCNVPRRKSLNCVKDNLCGPNWVV